MERKGILDKCGKVRRRMLILLPDGRIHRLTLPFLRISFREAPLTATLLAALTPPELGFNIRICDASVSDVPMDGTFDLVAISIITGTAIEGYRLADHFRAKGATVVIGGVHATLLPEEASTHADSLMTGFAEGTWPEMCRDFCNGALKPRYDGGSPDLVGIPWPRRDLQKRFGYMMPQTVFATRGCRNTCDFCAVVGAKFGWHTRPVEEVAAEIASLPGKRFAFNDVSLCEDREYALALCRAIKPLRKKWGGLMTLKAASDESMLDALADAGCCYMLLGFESASGRSLTGIRKAFNAPDEYKRIISNMHARGMMIQGCFIFGLDDDKADVFDATADMIDELEIDIPRYAVYTPFPGTDCYRRMAAENRLLPGVNWSWYDTQHVVIRPKQMTPEELDAGFIRAWQRTFSMKSILRRLSLRRSQFPVAFIGNLAYRLYRRRLARDNHRFALSEEDVLR